MFNRLREELACVFERDPAARSAWEILSCYPGFHALQVHRLAHWCWSRGLLWSGRFLSHLGRFATGIEIHPGASIGRRVFIDHGMGVVIGETAEIGDDTTLYHGVTLGGTSWKKGKRHPTLGKNVVVGAGAKILGPITIGDGAKIGSNAVVVKDVPPEATVVGIPGRIVEAEAPASPRFAAYAVVQGLDDPMAKAMNELIAHSRELEQTVAAMREKLERLERLEREPGDQGSASAGSRGSGRNVNA